MGPSDASELPPAFAGQHEPKPLMFDPGKLPGLSERLIRSHWENDYGGAVKALNVVEQKLASLLDDPSLPPYVYGNLKREELLRTGSVRLHELYFGGLGGDGKAGPMEQVLAHAFGTSSRWEEEFRRTANALAGGSGWVILAHAPEGGLHNYWACDHTAFPAGCQPLLVLDMYEHAYHLDYGAAAARYIDAFMQNVDWEEVSRRLIASSALRKGEHERWDEHETWESTWNPG